MHYNSRDRASIRPSGSPGFLLAGSFYFGIFLLQAANKNIWRQDGKWAKQVSTFIWAFLKMSPLLCRYCPQGLQYYLGIYHGLVSHAYKAAARRSTTTCRLIFQAYLHINGHFLFIFAKYKYYVFMDKKSKKFLLTVTASFPYFDPSDSTALSQTKACTTFHLYPRGDEVT
jgi:hypothetical protein